jgi:hypothetical protein
MAPRESHGCPFLIGGGTYSPEFVYPLQTAGSCLPRGLLLGFRVAYCARPPESGRESAAVSYTVKLQPVYGSLHLTNFSPMKIETQIRYRCRSRTISATSSLLTTKK